MIEVISQEIAIREGLNGPKTRFFLYPTGGYDLVSSKFAVSYRTSRGSAKYFVKISNSTKCSTYLRREAENIKVFLDRKTGHVPRIIADGYIGNRYYLVESFIDGHTLSSSSTVSRAYGLLKPWLTSPSLKTPGKKLIPEEFIKRTEKNLKVASEFFRFDGILQRMDRLSPDNEIQSSILHGDFWHGNILIDKNGDFHLIDFTLSSQDEPPVDLVNLIADLDPRMLLREDLMRPYFQTILPDTASITFFALYELTRKVALKIEVRKMLYEECLLQDLNASMAEIREAGMVKLLLSRFQ
ncbi:MAG: aminoglycoside phosphotransferase family protein [Conexivisphaerales archaeon]